MHMNASGEGWPGMNIIAKLFNVYYYLWVLILILKNFEIFENLFCKIFSDVHP